MEKHPIKKYPIIGACGLDCGLCPSFHRDGTSRCPGCCGAGFWEKHPGCGFITCCVKQRGLDVCGQCNEFEFCPRIIKHLKQAQHNDSTLSYQPVAGNFDFIQKYGLKAWVKREQEKIDFLRTLLDGYNDGRSKTFYCLSVQLLPLDKLKAALEQAQKKINSEATNKDRAKLVRETFNALGVKSGVELKLRGKTNNK